MTLFAIGDVLDARYERIGVLVGSTHGMIWVVYTLNEYYFALFFTIEVSSADSNL